MALELINNFGQFISIIIILYLFFKIKEFLNKEIYKQDLELKDLKTKHSLEIQELKLRIKVIEHELFDNKKIKGD